ncbi:hypothetical protein [Pectobacterium carotovorum]|uniref:hypothetical protein n=1 Tax=Pectobacterium carotovorum TaxID=554 RepID=UPI002A827887|nr:hypothetical protein [Pectobacterium carotovorum]MDY4373141.1 hypothetical protein [Pectobacterium carotovorum subsp. carotovorum]
MILLTKAPDFVWEIRHQANTNLHHLKATPAILGCKPARESTYVIAFQCST